MTNKNDLETMGIVEEEPMIPQKKNIEKNNIERDNVVSLIIKAIAVILSLVAVVGFIVYYANNDGVIALCVLVGGMVSAVFTYGLGEIIQKLQNIEDNTRK